MERLSAEEYLAALRRVADEYHKSRRCLYELEGQLMERGIALKDPDAPPDKN